MRLLSFLAVLALASPAHAEEGNQCLAAFASRYIGETERNLGRTLAIAAQSDVVLLFDEADALFGKRSETRDAHDRYANQEVSYLLERLERFGAIEVLASNGRRMLIAGFDRHARGAGLILIETETGVRVIEFASADRDRATAYTRAAMSACR